MREILEKLLERGFKVSFSEEIGVPVLCIYKDDSLVYFPVFQNSAGWWGQLLGTNARIRSKIIVSPECQLYEIGTGAKTNDASSRQLFAAEVAPRPQAFRKIREIAATIKDMIATDNGTILTLLSGNNENKIKNCINSLGGEFLGTLGKY